jgi:hypothetical protein
VRDGVSADRISSSDPTKTTEDTAISCGSSRSPGGAVDVFAEDPDGVVLNQPANVAFFGADFDRLAVSSLGGWNLSAVDAGTRGLPLRYPEL